MKKLATLILTATCMISCGNSANNNNPDGTKRSSAADTITSVTNPGVGSAADDAAKKP